MAPAKSRMSPSDPTAKSRARIDRRASPARASGSAPSITAKLDAWRRRSLAPRRTAKRAMPMDSNELMLVGLLLLAALSVAAIVFLLINPYLSGEHRTDKGSRGVTANRAKRIAIKTQAEVASNRRRRGAEPDHGRALLFARTQASLRESRQAHRHRRHQSGGDGIDPRNAMAPRSARRCA